MMIPSGRLAGIVASLLSLVFLLSGLAHLRGSEISNSYAYSNRPSLVSSVLGKASNNLQDVQNRTLGVRMRRSRYLGDFTNIPLQFQKIFAISLPERTDKQDGIRVASSLTNLSVTFLDGVYGSDVSPKALPYSFDRKPSVVGAWRAHMNVAAKMIDENIQSALILEDDADWDVALKYQMVEFARGSRFLLNTTPKQQILSPYGDNWDMLWTGHCGVLEQRSDSRRWIVPEDATVEPSQFHRDNVETPTLEPFGKEHTRMVFKSANGCCLAGYALSLSGARKTLNMMSLRAWDGPVDWGFNDLCKNGITNFTCISPFPQLIGVHRPAGNQSRWSDIESIETASIGKAHSLHLVFPTRMNIDRLLTGSTKFLSQYPESTGMEMEFDDIINFNGYPSAIPFELAPSPK